jgi:hypothetical protein
MMGDNRMSGHDRQLAWRNEIKKAHDPALEEYVAGPCEAR